MTFLDYTWLGNTARAWLTAAAITVVALVLLVLVRRTVVSRLGRLASRTSTFVDDAALEVLRRTRVYFLAAIAIALGTRALVVAAPYRGWIDRLLVLVVLLQLGRWATALLAVWVDRYVQDRQASGDASSVTTVRALGYAGRVLLWLLVGITALETVFSYDVTALVTGLGIAGIAVALAVQNILGDLLAALSIVLDKPFVVGDFIIVGDKLGTVEQIGLKTTRLRALSGEQLIFSNAELLKSTIQNFKRMYERRVVVPLEVHVETPPEVLARLPARIRALVERQSPVRFDRSHVAAFTERSVKLETVYYVLDPDYNRHADILHAVLLGMREIMREEGVSVAHQIIEEIREFRKA